MSARKRLISFASAAGVARVQRWIERKPPGQVESAGAQFGRMVYWLARRRRDVALSNLALAFPEWPRAERERVARACFEHFGIVAADFLASRGRTLATVTEGLSSEGGHLLDEALAVGRGILLATGHFGYWERAAAWFTGRGVKLNVVARDANQAGVTSLVNQVREGLGATVIPRGNAARRILESLKRNEVVAILIDQNAEDAFLPFFGRPAGTNLGLGVIHERTGAPVLAGYGVRLGPQKYHVCVSDWVVPDPGYSVRGEGTMRAVNRVLEGWIRQYPEQWLWFHDRWRNAREAGLL